MTITYVSEAPEHAAPLEAVLDHAFGPGRFAKTSERVRERGARFEPTLTRVAMEDGRPVGVCRMWTVSVGSSGLALYLGPLAVEPAAQHHGVGAHLVRACVDAARAAGASAIITVGRAAFFEQIGFSLIPKGRVALPGPVDHSRFLWNVFAPGAGGQLAGMVSAPPGASRA